MKNTASRLVIVASLALCSCLQNFVRDEQDDGKVELRTVTVKDYSMGIPASMTKATQLNDDASLQFQNIFKEIYVIVIDENKQKFINVYVEAGAYDSTLAVITNYANTQAQLITSKLEVISKSELARLRINNRPAASMEFDARFEGVKDPITYFLTFIEGKENLYMVMAWTLQDQKDKYRKVFNQMARSFKIEKKSEEN